MNDLIIQFQWLGEWYEMEALWDGPLYEVSQAIDLASEPSKTKMLELMAEKMNLLPVRYLLKENATPPKR